MSMANAKAQSRLLQDTPETLLKGEFMPVGEPRDPPLVDRLSLSNAWRPPQSLSGEITRGLHSFLNISLMDTRRRNTSAFRLRFSLSFASRLQRPSDAKVLSTTQRFGKTTKPLA
jgi:hypothetical protein